MNDDSRTTKTLGPVSASFINEFLARGKTVITLTEAVEVYGNRRLQTIKFIHELIKRGILAQIKSGLYLILQMGQESSQLTNWPLIASLLANNREDYFISHYSAMRLHGMTNHPLLDVYITRSKQGRDKKISSIRYHFIYSKPEHFWGGTRHWISRQNNVMVSDLERTILDGFDRPDLCGGFKEIVRGIWLKQKEINWDRLIEYATAYRTKAAVKRLGFILELFEIGDSVIPALLNITESSKANVLMDPLGSKEGTCRTRWHVQVNINIDEMKASTEMIPVAEIDLIAAKL